MIDVGLYVSFIAVSTVVILVPGPNILLIIATSLTRGRVAGVRIVFGAAAAMALQLFVAAVGTAWLAEMLSGTFEVVRWLGVIYLAHLGISNLRTALATDTVDPDEELDTSTSYWRGFLVALTNPKTILFFGAFLPQFTTSELGIARQITLLSMTFVMLATAINLGLAFGAGALRDVATRKGLQKWFHGVAGSLFIGSGIGLALARRT